MEVSDHWPCVVEIATSIPKSQVFRFENYWLNHEEFVSVAGSGWVSPSHLSDPARKLTTKFKNLRKELKEWKLTLPKLSLAIEKIKLVLHLLESIELVRDLSLPEWNFKELVSKKLIGLLKQQRAYWRQRGKVRWVKEGDAATKFFHAHGTIRHNKITSLKDASGNILCGHEQKPELLWNSFKLRMGISEHKHMLFDLSQLIQPIEGLQALEAPFSTEEIEGAIAQLPNNKSPGPDGFTNEFIKGCWPLIAEDFLHLCNEFQNNQVCLRSINGSHIVLIPKIDGPQNVSDYRPISLLISSVKLITKLLANRLQSKIKSLVFKNQYGFIKSRTI